MKTEHQPRFTGQELTDQIKKHVEALASATDASHMSTEMLAYLETCARFHQYSLHNLWCILMAKPNATQVAGFHAWNKLNRFVRKGEKGIPILAPIIVKDKNGEKEAKSALCGFKVVYVFDVSQTDGEPLPEPPDWKSPEKNSELTDRLVAFAKERGITVTERALAGEIQGVSKGGSIDIAPQAGTSTLIHEIAHELMHRNPDSPKDKTSRELEAEAVAYVVSHHFELESTGSPNYIALHGASSELILKHLGRISKTAGEIINSLIK